MKYISIEEILFIHYRIVCELQHPHGSFALVNPQRLEAAVARPQQSLAGNDAYTTASEKAAALTESLINGHPFEDGNKRVGITAGCVFLMVNGHTIKASDDDIYTAAMSTAKGEWKFPELKSWFEKHAM